MTSAGAALFSGVYTSLLLTGWINWKQLLQSCFYYTVSPRTTLTHGWISENMYGFIETESGSLETQPVLFLGDVSSFISKSNDRNKLHDYSHFVCKFFFLKTCCVVCLHYQCTIWNVILFENKARLKWEVLNLNVSSLWRSDVILLLKMTKTDRCR